MIGASHYRIGGDRLAAGAGRFVADVRVPGMLHAVVLRSRHAHARLVSIDAKRALELAGVRAVLTAADVPAAAIIPNRVGAPPGTVGTCQVWLLVESWTMTESSARPLKFPPRPIGTGGTFSRFGGRWTR